MNWFYSIGAWTWIFCRTWYGNLIWFTWLIINAIVFAINLFYPLANAYAGGKDKDLKYNPLIAMLTQAILFIFVLWIGSLFY